jgi:hypothetical protein
MSPKWLLGLSCLMITLLILGSTPQKGSSIEGAWRLVHATVVDSGSVVGEYPGRWMGDDMKMWSRGYFSFVGRMKSDTAFSDSYGGGRYKLDGKHYEEEIQYHMVPALVGKTMKMWMEIRNDTLVQTWPVGENGQIDKKNFREEKYIRLD